LLTDTKSNENGLTLIELLAVIAILGIISGIAIVGVSQIIQKSKDQALVANAIHLIDSANFYISAHHPHDIAVNQEISYQKLYNEGYIEKIRDPDANEYLNPDTNGSYAVFDGKTITGVCFKGIKRNLCKNESGGDAPISLTDLSISRINNN
jgi:type IV pilus assembly protein PilA